MELLHSPKNFSVWVLNTTGTCLAFVLVTVPAFPVWWSPSSNECIPFRSTFLPTENLFSTTCCAGACGALVEMIQEKMTATSNPWMMTRHSCDADGLTVFPQNRILKAFLVCPPCLDRVRLSGLVSQLVSGFVSHETLAAGKAETKKKSQIYVRFLQLLGSTVVYFFPPSPRSEDPPMKSDLGFSKRLGRRTSSTHHELQGLLLLVSIFGL